MALTTKYESDESGTPQIQSTLQLLPETILN